MTLKTSYEFTLPRGYVDQDGRLHRTGAMRLATARDELEPLRDPRITGPDDPRLTILVLTRVVEKLGDVAMVTAHEIEGLFAVDLAFLQDFYGVINFGSQEEYDALISAQESSALLGTASADPAARPAPEPEPAAEAPDGLAPESEPGAAAPYQVSRPNLRRGVEELPRRTQ
ncbi:hypothetical protein [Nocardioides sp. W7]|uniref:hypothetical protein n=1 Tax=Nocardioides sp. W7 TaxID=2931390 RepID=UPI001FD4242B|nr:hypothetical protein [Nocardioides sp. W7]